VGVRSLCWFVEMPLKVIEEIRTTRTPQRKMVSRRRTWERECLGVVEKVEGGGRNFRVFDELLERELGHHII